VGAARGPRARIPIRESRRSSIQGDILFDPGGISETEILLAYGNAAFVSKMGPLAGNHFLTITEGKDRLSQFGNSVLWDGAADIAFSADD
jgi:hypothetical protein